MRFGRRFFFPSLYTQIKDQNPSISEDFTKTFLKWPRDRLETMTSMLVFQGGKMFCASFCASVIACVCLCRSVRVLTVRDWMKYTRCELLLLVNAFFLFLLLFFRHLKITLDSEQPVLEQKQIIPSVWGRIKRFEHFQTGLYFFW